MPLSYLPKGNFAENCPTMFLFLKILLLSVAVQEAIIITPNATSATPGDTVRFDCLAEFEGIHVMAWYFEKEKIFYYFEGSRDFPQGEAKYSLIGYDEHFILEIKDLTLEDGGSYTCKTLSGEVTANLLVLEKPFINLSPPILVENDNAVFLCGGKYGGPSKEKLSTNHTPYLKMFYSDDPTVELPAVDMTVWENKTLHKEFRFTTNSSMNGLHIECEFGTEQPMVNASKLSALDILYPPRNINYEPQSSKYFVKTKIICSAEGNPEPDFEWRNNTGNIHQGNVLTVTEEMLGDNQWTCIASNSIKGRSYQVGIKVNFKAVSDLQDENTKGVPVYAIIIPVVATISLLAAAIIIVLVRRNRRMHHLKTLNEKGFILLEE